MIFRVLGIALLLWVSVATEALAQPYCEQRVASDTGVQGSWGYGAANQRFQSKTRITPDNVSQLELAWVFKLDDKQDPHSFPLVTEDTVIVGSRGGVVHALDKRSGCIRWQYDAGDGIRTAVVTGNEGVLYFGTSAGEVQALRIEDGSSLWRREVGEHFATMVSGTLAYHRGRLYVPLSSFEMFLAAFPLYPCCSFRGGVVALDAGSGEILWRAYTIEQPAEKVGSHWLLVPDYAPSGVPVWSTPTIDEARDQLIVGTGENYSEPASASSDSVMAFSLHDGTRRWFRQFTSGDAWNFACELAISTNCPASQGSDFDFGAPPILVSGGEGRDLLLAGQKSGMVYALDANDGSIVWQQRGASGGKLGGIHWGMAADVTRGQLYVPISDRSSDWIINRRTEGPGRPGLQALDIQSGQPLWYHAQADTCRGKQRCFAGNSAAITASPGLVWAGALDGVLRAYSAANARILWQYDAWGALDAVNGQAEGGAFDVHGPFVDEDMVFISSGYGSFDQKGGNAFVAFRLGQE